MNSQFLPKPLQKQHFSLDFEAEIDNITNNITLNQRQAEGIEEIEVIEDYLQEELQLPQPRSHNLPMTFNHLMTQYLSNKSDQLDPVFDMFQIVEDIVARYNKSITPESLDRINKKLYDLARDRDTKNEKRLNTTSSEYEKSTSNILDFYLLEIQQLNQRVKEAQEEITKKEQQIKEMQFKLFSLELRAKKDKRDSQEEQIYLNPFVPKYQEEVSNEEEEEDHPLRRLDTIKEVTYDFDEQSLELERLPLKAESLKALPSGPNHMRNLTICDIKKERVASPTSRRDTEVVGAVLESKAVEDVQQLHQSQYLLHCLEVSNVKLNLRIQQLAKEMNVLSLKTKVQQEEICILKKEKDYYFGELKIKHSELRRATKVISSLAQSGETCNPNPKPK